MSGPVRPKACNPEESLMRFARAASLVVWFWDMWLEHGVALNIVADHNPDHRVAAR